MLDDARAATDQRLGRTLQQRVPRFEPDPAWRLPAGPKWPSIVQSFFMLRYRHIAHPWLWRTYGDTFTVRLLPSSLFGRLMLVLTCGLVIAQLLSASISFAERESMLVRASGMRSAQRIADTVKLLDSMGPVDRARVAAVLSVPPLVVSLQAAPLSADSRSNGPQAVMFSTVLILPFGMT